MRVKETSEKAGLKLNIEKTKIMAFGPVTSRQIQQEKSKSSDRFYFRGLQITADGYCSHQIKRCLISWKAMINLDSTLKSRDITLSTKDCKVRLFQLHIRMWELDHKEGWVPKNWCFWIVVLEKTFKVLWTARRSNQLILKDINWLFIERMVAEAEAPILRSPDRKSWLIGKDSDAGKDGRQKEKVTAEDKIGR